MKQRSFGFCASLPLRVFAIRSPFRSSLSQSSIGTKALPPPSWCLVGVFAMGSPWRVEFVSDLNQNEDSSRTFPRGRCRAFAMGSPVLGHVAYFCVLDRNEGFFHPSTLVASRWGHPTGRVWFFSHLIETKSSLDIWSVFLQDGVTLFGSASNDLISSEGMTTVGLLGEFFRPVLGVSFCHPLVGRSALKRGGFHIQLSSLLARTLCIPLANEGVGLCPSSSGPVAARPPLAFRSASAASRWFFSPGRFMRWSSTHGGSLAALPEVGLLSMGCWRKIRVPQILCLTPLPGVRSRLLFLAKRYGRCSRQHPFPIAGIPLRRRARVCPSLPLKDCNSVLEAFLFWSTGTSRSPKLLRCPRNFLSSGGPFQFCHPSWVVSLVLQNLIGAEWSSSGLMKCVFLIWKRFTSWPLPRLGALGVPCYVFSWLSPRAGVGCPLLSSRALWRRLWPLPCSSVCGFHCTGPTNARQSQWETVISCAGGQVFPGPLGLRIVSDASGSFLPQGVAWRSYRRSLSPSGSGCRCHGCAGSRSRNGLFCVPWARCARAVAPSLLWEELAVILVDGRGCGSRAHPCEATT